jgi:hypothetical protein
MPGESLGKEHSIMSTHRTFFGASLAILLVALLALAGCSGSQPADEPQDEPQSAADTETAADTDNGATADGVYRAGAALGSPEVVALATVLEHPDQYDGKLVRIEGKIEQVCQKKGCWMILQDGDASTRVTFKDYGFFVPLDTKPGSVVRIDAEIHQETLSEEVAKHYEEETAGGDPDAIEGPQEVVSVVATGVEIDRGDG